GTTIEVPTLKGRVSMKIPPATSSGRVFRLPGYGMPRGKGGGAGDQFVTVKIEMPNDLTSAERELYAKLKAERGDNPRAYQGRPGMRLDQLTIKAQEALQAAQTLADQHSP